ncbi:condensation domain-containing protein [Streptomyces sp. NPDC002044]|uniref:condensation domain-containing protein n=1 Tax=Streptomyces sp. NPDC002044 TaxID=3154662 RepID=UPI0033340B0E
MTATLTAPHPAREAGHRTPLSDMQRSMLAHEALEELPVYTMPLCFEITGRVDADLLERALHHVVRRHPVLCSLYDGTHARVLGDAAPMPSLHRPVPDRAPGRAPGTDPALAAFLNAPFDLGREVPVRAALATTGPDRHLFALAVHHVAGDSVSQALMLRDIGAAYAALARDGRLPRPAPGPDFFAHARAEGPHRAEERPAEERPAPPPPGGSARGRSGPAPGPARPDGDAAWWAARLRGTAPQPYPRRIPPPEADRCTRISLGLALDADDTAGIRELARTAQVSPSAVLFTAVSHTIAAPGGGETVIGLPTALRDRPELRAAVGPLLNTLPVRTRLDATAGPAGTVRAHAAAMEESLTRKELPYSRILAAAGARHSFDSAPLFLHVVNIDHEPLRLRLAGARCTLLPVPRAWVVFPAQWEFGWSTVGNVRGELRLSADAFTAEHAHDLAGRFRRVLTRLLQDLL